MALSWRLALILVILKFCEATNYVVHPNVGVLFKKTSDVNLANTVWRHTVALRIFNGEQFDNPTLVCNNNSVTSVCPVMKDKKVRKTLWQFQQLEKELISDILNKEQAIKELIKSAKEEKVHRRKRGWVNFIGSVAKKVIGVATEHDVAVLQQHVNELAAIVETGSSERVHNVEHLHSYQLKLNDRIDLANSRIDNIRNIVTASVNASTKLKDYLLNKLHVPEKLAHLRQSLDKTDIVNNVLHRYSLHLQSLEAVSNVITESVTDTVQLLQGRLPVNVVSPRELQHILASISQKLGSISPTLQVESNIQYYYHSSHVTTSTFDRDHVYISIRIPVKDRTQDFDIYEVEAVPVPINHSDRNTAFTLVSGFSQYLGISQDQTKFVEFNDDPIIDFRNMHNYKQLVPRSVREATCSIKLFQGESEGIFSLCKQIVLSNITTFPEFVYSLEANEYLVYSPEREWQLMCDPLHPSQVLHSRGLWKITLNCTCQLQHAAVKILPQKLSCQNSSSYVSYSANLLAYEAIYKNKIDLHLNTKNFVDQKISFEFPDISNFNKSEVLLKRIDAKVVKELGKVSEISNVTKQNSLTSGAWLMFHWLDSMSDDSDIINMIATIALGIVYGSLLIFLYFKLTCMQQRIFVITGMLGASEALQFTLPQTTTVATSKSEGIDDDLWKTVIALLSVLLATYSIVQQWIDKCRKLQCQSKQTVTLGRLKTELFLCLYSDNEHLHLKVRVIPAAIDNVKIIKLGTISSVTFKRMCLNFILRIDWAPIQMSIPHTGRLVLPGSINLPISKWRAFKRMSKTYHTIKVVLVSEDKLRELSSFTGHQTGAHGYHPLPRMSFRENREENNSGTGENTFQLLSTDSASQDSSQDDTVNQDQCQFYI